MDQKKILWFKKPSNRFVLYYSFLRFDYRAYSRRDIEAIKNAPLPFTIILLVIILSLFIIYFYSVFIANEKPHIFWEGALLGGNCLYL